jgi:DNA-directed RNA polymerase subunit RPC12/RpoP
VPDSEFAKSIRCPECSSYDVRRSYPKGLIDAIMNARRRTPLRCRRCSYRFYRLLQPGEVLGIPDPSIPDPGDPEQH